MSKEKSGYITQRIAIAFSEQIPQTPALIFVHDPYKAAKMYVDLAESSVSLYTKNDYRKLSRILSYAAFVNARVANCEKSGYIIIFTFQFSNSEAHKEFVEYVKHDTLNDCNPQ